jgi:hypothetical protein
MLLVAQGKEYFVHFHHEFHEAPPDASAKVRKLQTWKQTICQIHEGKCQVKNCPDATVKLVAMHVAHCNTKLDQFTKRTGRIISFTRAIGPVFTRAHRTELWASYFKLCPLPGPRPFDSAAEIEFWCKYLTNQSGGVTLSAIPLIACEIAKRIEELTWITRR